jgi:hypothetical protein
MLGSRSVPDNPEVDRFECLRCDLVIHYSGSQHSGPTSPEK